MERWAIRRRLRRMHKLLVDSRYALEKASAAVGNKLLNDLLFMLACRRIIMLNMLDRELGSMGIPRKPGPAATQWLEPYLPNGHSGRTVALVSACEQEESYLKAELRELMVQPGLSGRTRQMLSSLLAEVDEDLRDLRFVRVNQQRA